MPKNIKKKIELLCPAGDLERLKTAVVFGADAIYCGLPEWSLRNPREITFNLETLKEGIQFAHKHGVKVYLTFNIFPHEKQIKEIKFFFAKASKDLREIDGVIVSDLGMLVLVKKYLPKVPIHISTQANTLNSEAVLQWAKLGAERVVLARELTLEEIKEIKKKMGQIWGEHKGQTSGYSRRSDLCSSVKLEVFGHGAMCVAYSGRCLLSKYFTGRESNLGDCAQSCRWKYKVKSCRDNSRVVPTGKYFLQEETRPDDLLEIQEDEKGTYILNSKELCALDILDQFIEAGIDSLKIEGRAKTVYYLATVTRVYRKAIDKYYELSSKPQRGPFGAVSKKEYENTIKELYKELNLIQNRGYSHGFLLSSEGYEQEYSNAAFKPPVTFIGIVIKLKVESKKLGAHLECYLVEVKNKFKVGEKIEIVTPDKIYKTKILEIVDEKGNFLNEILTPQEKVWVKFDLKEKIPERSILRRRK